MYAREIPKAVIGRLPRYYRHLEELIDEGTERISSYGLSLMMNSTSSQVRQDLNMFGGFGQQGYGYHVRTLHKEIGKILRLDRKHNMIVIGAGNLGQSLMNYADFEKNGFVMKGMFDVNPRLIGLTIRGIEIQPIDELERFIAEHDIQIAALTIPRKRAEEIAKRLVSAGIQGIWNFAHIDLTVPENVIVENVHLSDSLMKMSFQMEHQNKTFINSKVS